MKYKFVKVLKIMVIVTAVILTLGNLIAWLWNALIPGLFGGPVINMWQAIGLFILSKIFFSGFGHKGGGCHYGRQHRWKKKFEKKFGNMSEEDRQRYKERFKKHWGACWGEEDFEEAIEKEEKDDEKKTM